VPGVLSYNLYMDSVLFANTTSTSYLQLSVPEGTYTHNVAAVFNGGWEGLWSDDLEIVHVNPVGVENEIIPTKMELSNYPNPFNPTTSISFNIKEHEKGTLSIYNIKGQLIESQLFESGQYNYLWDASTQSPGIYLYKFETKSIIETRKMLLLK
jgi:hypothetical protein